jgi:hypothetical protein
MYHLSVFLVMRKLWLVTHSIRFIVYFFNNATASRTNKMKYINVYPRYLVIL